MTLAKLGGRVVAGQRHDQFFSFAVSYDESWDSS